MIAFTIDLPRKSSRTSTHAVIVPSTALIREIRIDAPTVSFSAATASGLEIESQKPPAPSFVDSQVSAASGSTTTIERKVMTKPRDRAVPALSPRRTRDGCATPTSTLASCAAHLPLDPRHHALVGIEEVLLHPVPAAEAELIDRELPRPGRELLAVLLEDALQDRPVAAVSEH